jgi:hypothetical protein
MIDICQGAASTQTLTPMPSLTPTEAPTETPLPTETATATPTITPTLSAAGRVAATSTARAVARKATSDAASATASFFAAYRPISGQELSSYPLRHKGESVVVQGQVFNIYKDGSGFQIFLSGTYEAAVIQYSQDVPGMYKNSWVIVYGLVGGTIDITNAYGATITQPWILATFVKVQ